MEYMVRAVGGIESCYVSLPLSLIQRLDSTCPGRLPQVLALELRSLTSDNRPWHVAWSGCASSSSAIEIARQFAECINLPDDTSVSVRALLNVPKATLVTIEPLSEDDWEVMDFMAEAAEAAILKQVRIVDEMMRFPLWLHGKSIVTFLVVSTDPKKSIVQLVPGTEVAVAPKRRKRWDGYSKDACLQSIDEAHLDRKVLLRVQAPKDGLKLKSKLKNLDVEIELTSVALIHPETAKDCSFDALQAVVIVPRLLSKIKSDTHDTPQKHSSTKELSDESQTDGKDHHFAIVHLVYTDSVAKRHLLISQSLRHYLRVNLHSWIYVQTSSSFLTNDIRGFSVSSCQFVILEKKTDKQNDRPKVPDDLLKPKNMLLHSNLGTDMDTSDFTDSRLAVSYELPNKGDNDSSFKSDAKKDLCSLVDAWFHAQLDAINSLIGVQATSLVLGPKTFIHFEVVASSRANGELHTLSTDTLRSRTGDGKLTNEILYVLTASGELLHSEKFCIYEVSVDEDQLNGNKHGLNFLLENMVLGDPLSFYAVNEKAFSQTFNSKLSSLSWMGTAASEVIHRLNLLVSPASAVWFCNLNLPFPGHILIYGPSGSGKTLLASAAAKFFEEDDDMLAHVVFVCCSALASENIRNIRQQLCARISEALDHSPSIIVFDDLDSIISSSLESERSQASASVFALTEFILSIMDEYRDKRNDSCGFGPIAFVACVHDLNSVPLSLRASGRFDFHVQLPSPAASQRMGILKHEIHKRTLECSDDILQDVASKCDGYDAYDLAILVDRTIHAAVTRFLPPHSASRIQGNASLILDDFSQAMHEFVPVSMRDITKSAPEGGRSGWEDVGGLLDVRNAIKEMIELPSKFADVFAKCPLRLRSNVLLYGPPGCGKSHIVGAAAAAASLRFISIKGPELLNKYIGASEQAVRLKFD
ncbi:hypothetical protein Dimus_019277 [Dionaea muscipula]